MRIPEREGAKSFMKGRYFLVLFIARAVVQAIPPPRQGSPVWSLFAARAKLRHAEPSSRGAAKVPRDGGGANHLFLIARLRGKSAAVG